MATILDGKLLATKIKQELKTQVENLKIEMLTASLTAAGPSLAVIIVGDDPASRVYVNGKKNDCEEIGITSIEHALSSETTQETLLSLISELNNDTNVSGILVQLPLPPHIDEAAVINAISPVKDVDAFHPINIGKIMLGHHTKTDATSRCFLPCTPAGIIELIESANVDIAGKECVVVGRSNIVGKPLSMLLLHKHATVTICHSRTRNLSSVTRRADILIAAVGKPEMITADMVKEGAVVIDVGVNRLTDGKLVGDVAFDEVSRIASAITPVPGGVGPMTRAMLMKNVVRAAAIQRSK